MAGDKKTNDDSELFRQMMSGVKPLTQKKSAEKHLSPRPPHPAPKRPPTANDPTNTDFIAREHAPNVSPEEALFFARSGLQTRLLRQLKRGDLRPEGRLDLHGCTIAEAGILLTDFLKNAQTNGLRTVCVVHGKGHRSTEGRPVLKSQINQWLRDVPAVLAFSSAQPKDGGMGALYLLLKRM